MIHPSPDSKAMAASIDDPAAFGPIVAAHLAPIYRYLARRVGRELAEDLTAEVFLTAFQARGAYQHHRPTALPWLYGMAANVLRNHQRSEQRRLQALGRLAAERRFTASAEASVDDAVVSAAEVQQMAAALGALPTDWREAVVLVAVEGLSYEDAASAAQIPVGTIRSRLWRARQQLRQALVDERPAPQPSCDGRGRDD